MDVCRHDIDHSGSLGVSVKGEAWHRSGDSAGLAAVMSGASKATQEYLMAGGTGILGGDGNLNYAIERALETYYAIPAHLDLRHPHPLGVLVSEATSTRPWSTAFVCTWICGF
jgi:hypothetical protein